MTFWPRAALKASLKPTPSPLIRTSDAQRRLDVSETADRVDVRPREPHHRAGVAQTAIVGDRVGETGVAEKVDVELRDRLQCPAHVSAPIDGSPQ